MSLQRTLPVRVFPLENSFLVVHSSSSVVDYHLAEESVFECSQWFAGVAVEVLLLECAEGAHWPFDPPEISCY
jgi:hypothetical protein